MQQLIVVLQPVGAYAAETIRANIPGGFEVQIAESNDTEYLKSLIKNAHYAVAFETKIDPDVFQAGTQLKLVHKWGAGVDNLPLDTIRKLNLPLFKTTGSNA